MGLVSARFAQEFLIQFLDYRVFMALSQGHGCIFAVQCLGTFCTKVSEVAYICRLMRLTAAVYTAARTCHHFDEVVVCFAVLYAV